MTPPAPTIRVFPAPKDRPMFSYVLVIVGSGLAHIGGWAALVLYIFSFIGLGETSPADQRALAFRFSLLFLVGAVLIGVGFFMDKRTAR